MSEQQTTRPRDTFLDPMKAFAYFTECALATVEGLPKQTSGRERRRLEDIAADMVRHCKLFGIQPSQPFARPSTSRLNEMLTLQEIANAE